MQEKTVQEVENRAIEFVFNTLKHLELLKQGKEADLVTIMLNSNNMLNVISLVPSCNFLIGFIDVNGDDVDFMIIAYALKNSREFRAKDLLAKSELAEGLDFGIIAEYYEQLYFEKRVADGA